MEQSEALQSTVRLLDAIGIGVELRWDQCLRAWFFFVYRKQVVPRVRTRTYRVADVADVPTVMIEAVDTLPDRFA